MTFTNNRQTAFPYLSWEQIGSPECAITFFVIQTILLIVAILLRVQLLRMGKLHVTVRMLLGSVLLEWFATLFIMVYWVRTGLRDVAAKYVGVLIAGKMLMEYANFLIIVQVVLVGKGWTIVRRHLSSQSKMKIVGYSVFYVLAISFAVIAQQYSNPDNSQILYTYTTSADLIVIFLRIWSSFWFFFACYTTFKNYPRKRSFYKKFLPFFMVWLCIPALLHPVTTSLPLENRQQYNISWQLSMVCAAQIVLVVLYNPMTTTFPFHARTELDVFSAQNDGLIADVSVKQKVSDEEFDDLINNTTRSANVNIPEEVFNNIRGYGGGLVRKLGEVSIFTDKFLSVLKDWDGEEENDVDF